MRESTARWKDRKEVRVVPSDLWQQRLTCDIYIDGGLLSSSVPVSAAEQAGVLGLAAADRHAAAVLLARPPTAGLLHLYLISGQT